MAEPSWLKMRSLATPFEFTAEGTEEILLGSVGLVKEKEEMGVGENTMVENFDSPVEPDLNAGVWSCKYHLKFGDNFEDSFDEV